MDEPVKTGHVYAAGAEVFQGTEPEGVYRSRNALLVEALRSGDFTQAHGTLETIIRNGYKVKVTGNCCLGVACRVAEVAADHFTVVSRTGLSRTGFASITFDDEGERIVSDFVDGYPPALVSQWFGWQENNPNLFWVNSADREMSNTAANLNDNLSMNFAGIADAFERTFVTFTRKSVDDLTDDTETGITDLPE